MGTSLKLRARRKPMIEELKDVPITIAEREKILARVEELEGDLRTARAQVACLSSQHLQCPIDMGRRETFQKVQALLCQDVSWEERGRNVLALASEYLTRPER
jgi:hypothetical protein